MKYLLFFILCLQSGMSFAQKKSDIQDGNKFLWPLWSFKSTKLELNKRYIRDFEALNLRMESDSQSAQLFINKKIVLDICGKIFESQFEVFDSSYLLVSFFKGSSWGGAGPDYFPRDSVYIIDLKTSFFKSVSLPNILLTRSANFLIDSYGRTGKVAYKAITKINFSSNQITLVDQYSNFRQIELSDMSEFNLNKKCEF